jgi:peptidyl-prolyl cis-trans isomerase B (cyclophilin B)
MKALTSSLIALCLALSACGSSSDDKKAAEIPAGGDTTATPATTTPSASPGSSCKDVSKPKPKKNGGAKKPTAPLDTSKTWKLTFVTNCGSFTVTLDLKSGPNASASMVSLARSGFFDNTVFHRIVPDFVIQGGDPTGTGTGGPGYKTVDKPPADAKYTKGVVAMAKTGQEKPGTAGSQFYVVTGADAGLPPDYAVIGRVTAGLDVVEKIGQLGDASEQPTQTVVIEDVKVGSS